MGKINVKMEQDWWADWEGVVSNLCDPETLCSDSEHTGYARKYRGLHMMRPLILLAEINQGIPANLRELLQ